MSKAPGKHYRKGMSLVEAVKKFSDESAAEAWFVEQRWPQGITCPRCEKLQGEAKAKPKAHALPLCRLSEVFQREDRNDP